MGGGGRGNRTPTEQEGRAAELKYKDGMRAQEVLDHVRRELDQLVDWGDTVRPEHVIEAAGRLVGHGLGATQLAQLMSDMPAQGGEGLASWVRMHDMVIGQAEQALVQENNLVRHRMGIAGIRMLAEQHINGRVETHTRNARAAMGQLGQVEQAPEEGGGNALAPGGGPPGGMSGDEGA
jgi:hypothetical protein